MSEQPVYVKLGDLQVVAGGTLYAIGLGSCVAVVLYDAEARVGGFAHVMLPEPVSSDDTRFGRFAPTAVPRLVEMMAAAGADADRIFARIAGGAAMFAEALPAVARMGQRNVVAVKSALEEAGIPLRGEEVGGSSGRSVYFDTQDGSLTIRVVQRDDVLL